VPPVSQRALHQGESSETPFLNRAGLLDAGKHLWESCVQKLRSIQVLRAIAACAVALLHCYEDPNGAVGNEGYGAAGVDLFFVISGFIMTNVASQRSAGEFLRDRLWRIYPLWWVALLPWLLILPRGPLFLLSSVTLWPIYGGTYFVPVLQVGWTLSFELLFYAGMTAAIVGRAWLPLALYALLLAGALTTQSALLAYLGSPMVLEFLMGVIIARLPRRAALGLLIPAGILLIALSAAGTGSAKATLLDPQFALWRAMVWGMPAALILWGAVSIERRFESRLFDVPVAVGDASYSVYLFHPIVAYGLDFAWPVRLALAVTAGCGLHLLVERRIMAARRTGFSSGLARRQRVKLT
jgi:exopolysaccharide production protein ExoZ